MRILIVSHYFPPETGAPQARLSALAAAWAAGGDAVTVLTGMPNHPTGVLPPEYRRAVRRRERRDGYAVLRTWLYATPNEGIARKTASHLSFMVSSVLLGLRPSGRADTVVVSSPTFFSIASAWLLARLKRARLVRSRHEGRETHYSAQPRALAPLVDWMSLYGAFWRERFDRLEDLLKRMEP